MDLNQAIGLAADQDRRPWAVGVVRAVTPTTLTLTVDGGTVAVPYLPGEYAVRDTVAVIRDPHQSGVGQFVVGRLGRLTDEQAAAWHPPAAGPTEGRYEATILPLWSGTWRSDGGYDRWQANSRRYGGVSTMWQGAARGANATLSGVVVYGDQVVNLGATRVEDITVQVDRADGTGSPVLHSTTQGDPHPGQPAPTGDPTGGTGRVPLPDTALDRWRTGAYRGLVLDGDDPLAVFGAAHPGALVLRVTYWKPI